MDDPLIRFMKYVDTSGTCWIWRGGKYPNGYGKFKLANGSNGGRAVLAHRYAYEVYHGSEISHVINHRCENKACVNPAHLEDVTQGENLSYSRSNF